MSDIEVLLLCLIGVLFLLQFFTFFCSTSPNNSEIQTIRKDLRVQREDLNFLNNKIKNSTKDTRPDVSEILHNYCIQTNCCIQTIREDLNSLNNKIENLTTEFKDFNTNLNKSSFQKQLDSLKKEIVVLKSQSTKFTEDLLKQLDSLKKELAVLKSQYTKATDDLRILRFRVESLISESEPSLDSESEALLDSATKNPETNKLSKKLSLAKLTK